MESFENIVQEAESIDALQKSKFLLPEEQIYLLGNSLGPLSKSSNDSICDAVALWKTKAIGAWTHSETPWFTLSEHVAGKLAKLAKVDAEEISVGETLTTQLLKLLYTYYSPNAKRTKILIDKDSFPSDRYAVESVLESKWGSKWQEHLEILNSDELGNYATEDIENLLQAEDLALVLLPGVVYKTGQLLDIGNIQNLANQSGVFLIWDLAHAMGVVDLDFKSLGIQAAIWCNYKWLNGGPGAPGALYIDYSIQKKPAFRGWFGLAPEKRFQPPEIFEGETAPAYQLGTPGILSLAALNGSLDVFDGLDLASVRERSLELTACLEKLLRSQQGTKDWKLLTPMDSRGGHLSYRTENAAVIAQFAKSKGLIIDHRRPDIIRIAPSPLFNDGEDLVQAAKIFGEAIEQCGDLETDELVP